MNSKKEVKMDKEKHYLTKYNVENKTFKLHILARGIILDKNKLLVCKNSTNTFLPGGHLEFMDDLEKTLKREIFEEMGLECEVSDYIGCVECIWEENNIYHQEIDHIFQINGINEQTLIKSKEKHIEFYWINIEDMEKENFLPISVRKIIMNKYNGKTGLQYYSEIKKRH
jgi:ADP-ribose pyrophosphatase YjhB (NUDIX family)